MIPRIRTVALVLASMASLSAAGCVDGKSEDGKGPSSSGASGSSGSSGKAAPAGSGKATLTSGEGRDAGAFADNKDAGASYDGPLIGALFLQTPIMSDMDWPKKEEDKKPGERGGAVRIGYLRQGSKVPVIPEPHVKSNCKDGWYELVQGGFVCGRYASLDLNHPKIKNAPHPPDPATALPYQYGYNVTNGTPLYRTVPSREERLRLEPWMGPKKAKPKPRESGGDVVTVRDALSDDGDAGLPLQLAKSNSNVTLGSLASDPWGTSSSTSAEGELDAGTPWYLRDYDGGKPQVTLDELRGEGPMARRMVKGFFVAIDKEYLSNNNAVKWWKTTMGLLAPYERIYLHKTASEFHGVWFDRDDANANANAKAAANTNQPAEGAEPAAAAMTPKKPIENLCKVGSKAQLAVVIFYKAKKYVVSANKKVATAGDSLPRHSAAKLTGEVAYIGGSEYDETDEGWWLRASDAVKTKPGEPPRDLAPGEKWIDVNLTTQTLVAYEGDKAVFATAVSTGKKNEDEPEKDHKTPTGTWRIREKHIAATMDGDVASDGPYSIEDVPYIMYFNGSYALHGAFWHNNFGRMQSHGCVNLAPQDAKALFAWTEPRMPDNWHGVWSTPEKPGTRVVVHEEPDGKTRASR